MPKESETPHHAFHRTNPAVAGLAVGLALLAARADARPGSVLSALPDFVSSPGHMELTGRLLARPNDRRGPEARALLSAFSHDRAAAVDIWSIEVPPGLTETTLARQLVAAGDDLFAWIRPDWRVFVQAAAALTPNDPEFPLQWHHQAIHAPQAWRASTGLPEVIIATVDTGVDLLHPDLSPNLIAGYCSHLTVRLPQVDSGVVQDAHGHGTCVAGVAGAVGDNLIGPTGVGWNLSIMPVRATNPLWPTGGATSMDIINGALWAADHGARIVNISFSGVSEPYVQDLGAQLRARGVLLVWPIDNNNADYGASFDHPDVLVVAGTDATDARAASSSFGAGVDLSAPAVSIFTTTRGGGSWWQHGNSFAAPIVAGAAGVILSAATELTPAQVERVLEETADDLGGPGRDPHFGHGRVNLERAVWLAPLRQFALLGAAPAPAIRAGYTVDDLYTLHAEPRDLSGDGSIDDADLRAALDLIRYDEAVDLTRRP